MNIPQRHLLTEEELRKYCRALLEQCDLDEKDAEILIDTTVTADLRGVSSHGISRLKHYIERLNKGLIKSRPELNIEEKTDSVYLIDADNGLGQAIAYRGMALAVEKAKEKGICCVGIKNTNHIGLAGYYSELAAKNKMVGLITANTNPAMAPWGGVKALLGTNPFAVAVPARERPIILDMATTNVARGKIRVFEKQGKLIPPGWAKDTAGKDTRDPKEAIHGTLSPVGGPKGYGMALIIDILAGIITGSKSSDEVSSLDDMTRPIYSGNFLFAFNVERMIDYSFYLERVEELKSKIKNSPKQEEVKEILLAGEIEYKLEDEHKHNGLAVSPEMWEEVKRVITSYEKGDDLT